MKSVLLFNITFIYQYNNIMVMAKTFGDVPLPTFVLTHAI